MSLTIDLEFLLRRSVQMVQDDPVEAQETFRSVQKAVCPACHKPVKHREGTQWCEDRQMSEDTLKKRVMDRAKRRGWRYAHAGKGIAAFTKDGQPIFVTSMAKGWPDLFLLRESDGRSLVIELKKEDGVVEPEQLEWLTAFNTCGIPAIVARPSDLRLGRVNSVLA
jgi:hypothetical protein